MKARRTAFAALALALIGSVGAARVQAQSAAPHTPGYALLSGETGRNTARQRLSIFAADSMMGREATTEGERKASAFIADNLQKAGALPGGDLVDGQRSYFQQFKVQTASFAPDGASLSISGLGDLRLGRDWIALPNTSPSLSESNLPLVFAGYGISAPGVHDDYAGLDVAGKIAVVVSGKPAGLDSVRFAFGTVDAGSFQSKYVSALQHRAAGILFLSSPFFNENWEPFAVQAKSLAVWGADEQQPIPPAPFIVASQDLSHRLAAAMGLPADIMDVALRGEAVQPAQTNLTASLTLNVVRQDATARNVVGYLPGKTLPEEFVAFGGHLDHHGVIDGKVYNGADDDGSGSMSVLDIAEAFAKDRAAGLSTDRSLLFVWHTAEEKGLIGSDYFTRHPQQSILGDIRNAVAQINIDMVGRENPDSMYVVGAYRLSNEYGARVDSINQVIGPNGRPMFGLNTHFDNPDDPEQIYQRSDHYNYARFGVPIVFFFDGMGADWRKNTATDDYHRPTDDVDKINFDKMARAEQLVYAIGRETANAPHRPRINPDVHLEPVE